MRRLLTLAAVLALAGSPAPARAQDDELVFEDEDDGDELVFEDEDDGDELVFEDEDDGDELVFEDEDDGGDDPPAEDQTVTGRLRGRVTSVLAVDTSFEGRGERIVEWRNRFYLEGQLRVGRNFGGFVSGRLDHFGVVERPNGGETFNGFNGTGGKWDATPELREAWVELSAGPVDLRFGQQIFAWGVFEALGPADPLNPRDLRRGILVEPDQVKVPVFAARAALWLGGWQASAVLLPFFTPDRYVLFGQDWAGLTGASNGGLGALPTRSFLPREVEDKVQDELLYLDAPDESPMNAQGAVRVRRNVGDVTLEASVFNGWDRLPSIRIDPDLLTLFDPNAAADAFLAAGLRLQNTIASGGQVFDLNYRRLWLFGLGASWLVGDFTLKGEAAFSPSRGVYRQAELPDLIRRPVLESALGFDWTWGTALVVAAQVSHTAFFDLEPGDHLYLAESPASPGETRTGSVGQNMLGVGTITWTTWREQLDLELRGSLNVLRGDSFVGLNSRWRLDDHQRLAFGVAVLQGPTESLGGLFDRNDAVSVEYRYVF